MNNEILVIGIGGHAVGIDAATGAELWRRKLKGGALVTIYNAGSHVLAGAGGELFCLETSTGHILWNNGLKGLGRGLIAFASSSFEAAAADLANKQAAQAAAVAAAGGS